MLLIRGVQGPHERILYRVDLTDWLGEGVTIERIDKKIDPLLKIDGTNRINERTGYEFRVGSHGVYGAYDAFFLVHTSDGQLREDHCQFIIRPPMGAYQRPLPA